MPILQERTGRLEEVEYLTMSHSVKAGNKARTSQLQRPCFLIATGGSSYFNLVFKNRK